MDTIENVRIAILDQNGNYLTAMDNDAPNALHYTDDVFHTYLKGSAASFKFTTQAQHADSKHLFNGAKLSFVYNKEDYMMNLVITERDEYYIECEAWSLPLEFTTETKDAYKASKAMSLAEYVAVFNGDKAVEIGVNEVSESKRTLEWSGSETFLNRLYSIATNFDAEIEFVTKLNDDYSLNKIVMNVYKENSDKNQGVGSDRRDEVLRYGSNVDTVSQKIDSSEVYSAIKPIGKDGLTIANVEFKEYDDEGNLAFYTEKGSTNILAPVVRDQFPSIGFNEEGRYTRLENWSYDTDNAEMLAKQALTKLKDICEPIVEFVVTSNVIAKCGDTFTVQNDLYDPVLILDARVLEQEVSFSEKRVIKTLFGNYKVLQSEISDELTAKIADLKAQIQWEIENNYATKQEVNIIDETVSEVKGITLQNKNDVARVDEFSKQVDNKIVLVSDEVVNLNGRVDTNTESINNISIDTSQLSKDAEEMRANAEQIRLDMQKAREELEADLVELQEDVDAKNSDITKLINDNKVDTDKALTDANTAIVDANKKIAATDENVTNINTSITNINNELATKAEKEDVDVLKQTVSNQATEIKQNSDSIALKADSETVDALNQTVTNQSTLIEQNAEAIALKASTTDVDAVKKTVTAHDSKLTQTAEDITSLVAKTDDTNTALSEVKQTADGLTTKVGTIEQNADSTSTKLSELEQNVNGFKTTVSNTYETKQNVDAKTNNAKNDAISAAKTETASQIAQSAQAITQTVSEKYADKNYVASQINQKAGEITSTVSSTYTTKSDFNTGINNAATDATTKANNALASAKSDATNKANDAKTQAVSLAKTETTSQVKQLSDSITSTVSRVEEKVDGIQIGGRNLLSTKKINPASSTLVDYDGVTNTWTLSATSGAGGVWGAGLKNVNGKDISIEYGETVVLSYEVFSPITTSIVYDVNNYPTTGAAWSGNDNDTNRKELTTREVPANQWKRFSHSYSNSHNSNTGKVSLYDDSSFNILIPQDMTFKIRNLQIEKGTIPSDWSPCQRDIDASIDSALTTSKEYTNSQITQKSGEITATVSATYETKTNVATNLNNAKSYADTKANNALASAKTDATNKANDAKTQAVSLAKTETTSQVKQLSDSITSTVSKVEEKVDGISIGSRNYLRNSGNFTGTTGWSSNGGTLGYEDGAITTIGNSSGISNNTIVRIPADSEFIITATMKSSVAKNISSTSDTFLHSQVWTVENTSNIHQDYGHNLTCNLTADTWGKVTMKFKTPKSANDCYYRLYLYQIGTDKLWVKNIKLEQGNKSSDWTPAPEDVDASIDAAVTTSKEYTNSQIQQTANSITSTVSATYTKQSDFNLMKNQYNWTEVTSATNLNDFSVNGNYFMKGTLTNSPVTAWAYLRNDYVSATNITQTIWKDNNPDDIYTRQKAGSTWTSWQRTATAADLGNYYTKTQTESQIEQTASQIRATVNTKVTNESYDTANTGGSNANKWTRFLRTTITNQYADVQVSLDMIGQGTGDSQTRNASLYVRHKQQGSLGSATSVTMDLVNSTFLVNTDIKAVVTTNSSSAVIVDYYVYINTSYTGLKITPITKSGGGTIEYISNTSFGDLPSGSQTFTAQYNGSLGNARDALSKYADLKITTDGISTEVGKKVGKSEVISTINQSAESVTINASKINLQGALTISQFTTSDKDKINNGISTANTANSAASIAQTKANDAYTLANTAKTNAGNAWDYANTVNGKADTAQSTANTAKTNAGTAQTRADNAYTLAGTANSTANTANNQVNSWKKTGTTMIDGGNIYADSLSVISSNMGILETYYNSDWNGKLRIEGATIRGFMNTNSKLLEKSRYYPDAIEYYTHDSSGNWLNSFRLDTGGIRNDNSSYGKRRIGFKDEGIIIQADSGNSNYGSPNYLNSGIELVGKSSYIDFHDSANSTADYKSRIVHNHDSKPNQLWMLNSVGGVVIESNQAGINIDGTITLRANSGVLAQNTNSSAWIDIRAKGFVQSSAYSLKTNFKDLSTAELLEAINKTDIVEYQFKDDVKNGRSDKYVGMILNDDGNSPYKTSSILANDDNTAYSTTTAVGVMMGAIKELSKQNKELQAKVDTLYSFIESIDLTKITKNKGDVGNEINS